MVILPRDGYLLPQPFPFESSSIRLASPSAILSSILAVSAVRIPHPPVSILVGVTVVGLSVNLELGFQCEFSWQVVCTHEDWGTVDLLEDCLDCSGMMCDVASKVCKLVDEVD